MNKVVRFFWPLSRWECFALGIAFGGSLMIYLYRHFGGGQ